LIVVVVVSVSSSVVGRGKIEQKPSQIRQK
jgi:hypothetical protein